ncbi:hypothetical protein DVH24_013634 [Malus domestica]|uniref:Small ribosomal subunit protein uS10 domain-containing protein n=1 Tax=Malus domestica TaxID=3750 RepID=A0A498JBF1_MALDO|nr:hypothetical protein DVH24_013634 [Malus domestica]
MFLFNLRLIRAIYLLNGIACSVSLRARLGQKESPTKVMAAKICIAIIVSSSINRKRWGLPPYTWKIVLPESRILYNVLRTPHVEKRSRQQFEMSIKKQFLVIKTKTHELQEVVLLEPNMNPNFLAEHGWIKQNSSGCSERLLDGSDLDSMEMGDEKNISTSNDGLGTRPEGSQTKVMAAKICIAIRSFGRPLTENVNWGAPPYTWKIENSSELPKSRVLCSLFRSPHVDKKSRKQFEMSINKQFLVLKTKTQELQKTVG